MSSGGVAAAPLEEHQTRGWRPDAGAGQARDGGGTGRRRGTGPRRGGDTKLERLQKRRHSRGQRASTPWDFRAGRRRGTGPTKRKRRSQEQATSRPRATEPAPRDWACTTRTASWVRT